MKRIVLLALVITGYVSAGFAQTNVAVNNAGVALKPEPGYIMINEFTGGFGLGITDAPYARGFFGFTTIHGYQVNKSFLVAGGAGVSFYNGGALLPLFLDLRYRVYISQWTPYIFGDGGFMLDISGKHDTRLFINPGICVSYTFSGKVAVNLATGLLTQFGNVRDSYINIKTGEVYKF